MSFVRTFLRWLLAAFVVVACAAQPIALDACRAACDTARTARIAAAPPCHHGAGASQIGQPVRPCSQDHAVVPADPGVGGPTSSLAFASPGPRSALFGAVTPRAAVVEASSGPPSIPIAITSNTPLRR